MIRAPADPLVDLSCAACRVVAFDGERRNHYTR